MRFMIIRKADPETEAGALPWPELIEAMGQYMQQMEAAGILLGGDGLKPTSAGCRIVFKGGRPTVLDGPFAETKEVIAGYTLINVASRQEALDWVLRWPQVDGHGGVELELRQLYEAEDFGEAFTPEAQEMFSKAFKSEPL